MKNFIESFITIVLLTCVVFASVSLMVSEAELVAAREMHSMVLRTVQESDIDAINDMSSLQQQLNNSVQSKHKNWSTNIKKLESSNSRDYYLVTLNYTIDVPIFGTVNKGKIEGYAR